LRCGKGLAILNISWVTWTGFVSSL
jgi:hypothetical protein